MSKLFSIYLISILLAILSHIFSVKDIYSHSYKKKEWFLWGCMSLVLIFFVGLRTRINDTMMYTHAYNLMTATNFSLNDISWALGDDPGFNLAQYFLIQLGFSAQSFLMLFAAVTNGIYLWFIRKYSSNLWFSLFLFLFWGGYTFTMAAIKQCVATAFALIGVDRFLNGRKVSFLFWVIIGTLFHAYTLMYLLIPFLTFRPWTNRTYLLLILFAIAGPLLQPMMGTVIDITTLLGKEYTIESFSGAGTSFFRFAVTMVPVIISFMTQRVISHRNDRMNNLFVNLTTLQALIMFVALFGTANYFARLANYFAIFTCLSLPWLISQFDRRSQKLLCGGAMIGYFLFFYYENGILRPFDVHYSAITLSEYLHSIF